MDVRIDDGIMCDQWMKVHSIMRMGGLNEDARSLVPTHKFKHGVENKEPYFNGSFVHFGYTMLELWHIL